jgi:hypothetical protein
MSASTSITVPVRGIPRELAMPRAQAWQEALGWLRRSRVQRGGRPVSECFGGLTVRDQMVVKGLAASLECSTEGGGARW